MRRKPLQLSETNQNGNVYGNGNGNWHVNGNGNEHGRNNRAIANPDEPNLRRKPLLQLSEINQYENEKNDRYQPRVENYAESNFRRKPVPPARPSPARSPPTLREKTFDKVDHQAHFQRSTHEFGPMRTGCISGTTTADAAAPSQDVHVNTIPPPQLSFRSSLDGTATPSSSSVWEYSASE